MRLRTAYQFIAFSASTPAQHAVADFLASRPDYPNHLADFFQAKRDLLAASLAESGFRRLHSAGSYFLLVDYTAVSDLADREFAEQLTREAGLATVPLSPFYRVPPCLKQVSASAPGSNRRIRGMNDPRIFSIDGMHCGGYYASFYRNIAI
jgi:methionine aminotransferase